MWIFTPFGFFSVVQKPGMSSLTVRARVWLIWIDYVRNTRRR
jgi:hypothetical protein